MSGESPTRSQFGPDRAAAFQHPAQKQGTPHRTCIKGSEIETLASIAPPHPSAHIPSRHHHPHPRTPPSHKLAQAATIAPILGHHHRPLPWMPLHRRPTNACTTPSSSPSSTIIPIRNYDIPLPQLLSDREIDPSIIASKRKASGNL